MATQMLFLDVFAANDLHLGAAKGNIEILSISIYANDFKNTNSILLLFDPIAFLDYISLLFFSQGDINNLFSTANDEGENFSQCLKSNKHFF